MSAYESIANRVLAAEARAVYILDEWQGIERGLDATVQRPQGLHASIHAPTTEIPQVMSASTHANATEIPQGMYASIHAPRTEIPQAAGGINTASQTMLGPLDIFYDPAVVAAKRKFLFDGYWRAERVLEDVYNEDARTSLAVWLARFNYQEDQLWGPENQIPPRMPEQNARGSVFWSQDEATQAAVMNADLLPPRFVNIYRPYRGVVTDAKVIDPRRLPEDHDRKCPICWGDLEHEHDHGQALELDCGHVFGETCIEHWSKESNVCPMCRDEKCG